MHNVEKVLAAQGLFYTYNEKPCFNPLVMKASDRLVSLV